MDLREHKNAIKRFLAIFSGSCSSLTLLYGLREINNGAQDRREKIESFRKETIPEYGLREINNGAQDRREKI